ncbi:MAG: phosphatase PAP2 family protein [Deltaproteobacteria bacterium]|nr:phosphatase PAP2 family protein [Deltaproteobacteria bacterium]
MFTDADLFLTVNHLLPPALARCFVAFTVLGKEVMPLFFLALLVVTRKERFRRALWCLASVLASELFAQVAKHLVRRVRPWVALADRDVHVFWTHEAGFSFPSGHTTAAWALATAVTVHWPRLGFVALPLATLVGVSRVVVGAHYPGDVAAGMVLGMAGAAVAEVLRWGIDPRLPWRPKATLPAVAQARAPRG